MKNSKSLVRIVLSLFVVITISAAAFAGSMILSCAAEQTNLDEADIVSNSNNQIVVDEPNVSDYTVRGGDLIETDGIYTIEPGSTGVIQIGDHLNVTLIGTGNYNTRFVELSIRVGNDTSLTIKDFYANQEMKEPLIDFIMDGSLNIEGLNQIDNENEFKSAVIHISQGNTLNLGGTGSLYGCKSSLCSYIGANKDEASGTIVFNSGRWFLKGTKSGAVIGGDSAAITSDDIVINGGEIYIKGMSQGALLGASAQAIPGDIYINGGLVELYQDFTGPAIGSADTSYMGKIYINGGSIKPLRSHNSWSVTGDQETSDFNSVWSIINASNSIDYSLVEIDVSKVNSDNILVGIDDNKTYYSGSKYNYVTNDVRDPHKSESKTATMMNWLDNTADNALTIENFGRHDYPDKNGSLLAPDNKLCFALKTGMSHKVTINGSTQIYDWDSNNHRFVKRLGFWERIDKIMRELPMANTPTWPL